MRDGLNGVLYKLFMHLTGNRILKDGGGMSDFLPSSGQARFGRKELWQQEVAKSQLLAAAIAECYQQEHQYVSPILWQLSLLLVEGERLRTILNSGKYTVIEGSAVISGKMGKILQLENK